MELLKGYLSLRPEGQITSPRHQASAEHALRQHDLCRRQEQQNLVQLQQLPNALPSSSDLWLCGFFRLPGGSLPLPVALKPRQAVRGDL